MTWIQLDESASYVATCGGKLYVANTKGTGIGNEELLLVTIIYIHYTDIIETSQQHTGDVKTCVVS